MAIMLQFTRHTKAETVVAKSVAVVKAALPAGSGISRDELLDLLLEILDGPEALEVYNRVMQTY
ncbi:hypothetical protein ASC89_21395 [Devosia sp. Root413D1]|uniref:hypothetical protein n=1 Tax=unclassified Devosia TaxID=196773 RepID=UPI0006FA5B8B|nr:MULTISPECIES: hypothetical protein [unclassified Devosia]KQU95169.1 hypothetical protein ASC68_18620 [Devosia sp. Root105]KQW77715.1 hypothetical protein ASC89_21395 [Devosia sp. Root413D1]